MADLSKLVNELSNLTVLEAAELAKKLQTRWTAPRKRMPSLRFNEGKVCDAIVRRLEEPRTESTGESALARAGKSQFPGRGYVHAWKSIVRA